MKNKMIEIVALMFGALTTMVGILSLPQVAMLPLSYQRYVALALGLLIVGKNGAYVILDFCDDGQINQSYKLPKNLPLILLAGLCLLTISCAARPDGTKTFGGLDAGQWGGVGIQAGTAYLAKRAEPVPTGKMAQDVTPAPTPAPSWWGLLGL